MEEIDGRPFWEYFDGYEHDEPKEEPETIKTCGMCFVVLPKEDDAEQTFEIKSPQIWTFVDLTDIPPGETVDLDENKEPSSNVYAIVESAEMQNEEEPLSDWWTPIKIEGTLNEQQFYIVDVEAFLHPITVIHNLGRNPLP
ncbi:hypothetical protein SEMRO_2648_G333650.1 [Seminavis robusta]|uniref:Uncharacterized protein n=1 Tax=Seminavis robusta TaxID=568900 RepID=A0A9N8HXX1_9STRA|nr:hypothetical protein SEMRO_2648_G333650.1 [Seminavis robusta]|eukprot:Sro2648_g333650.1 n/a (141) ;mRNA; f:12110-12745